MRRWLLLILCLLSIAAVAAPMRRGRRPRVPPAPPPPPPAWAVPADPIPVAIPTLDLLEAGALRIRARTEPRIPRFEATLAVRPLSDASSPTAVNLLLAAMLRVGGTKGLEGEMFSRFLAGHGFELEVEADPDFLALTVQGPVDRATDALGLLAGLATTPAIPAATLERARAALRDVTGQRAQQPLSLAVDRLHATLFGAHAYAARIDEEALAVVTAESLLQAHQRMFAPNRAMLAVTSPLEPSALGPMVNAAFKDWKAGEAPTRVPAPKSPRASLLLAPVPARSAAVVAGSVVRPANEIDEAAMGVLGRLIDQAIQARSESIGKAARGGARLTMHADAGLLWAWGEGADPATARDLVLSELVRIGTGELSDSEIGRARVAQLAAQLEAVDGMSAVVRSAMLEELKGRDATWPLRRLELLRTLAAAEVRRVARAVLGTGAYTLVLSGAEKALFAATSGSIGAGTGVEPPAMPGHESTSPTAAEAAPGTAAPPAHPSSGAAVPSAGAGPTESSPAAILHGAQKVGAPATGAPATGGAAGAPSAGAAAGAAHAPAAGASPKTAHGTGRVKAAKGKKYAVGSKAARAAWKARHPRRVPRALPAKKPASTAAPAPARSTAAPPLPPAEKPPPDIIE